MHNKFQKHDLFVINWSCSKFLILVFVLQLGMWGTVGLDLIGIHIPLLRQIIGFLYLTIVPGMLILWLLKIYDLGFIPTLLNSIGLSLITIITIGFFINVIYPLFGIDNPFSLESLMFTFSVVVLILCISCYFFRNKYSNKINLAMNILPKETLFLCLIPFMSIFGTYLVNYYRLNIILLIMIFSIAIICLAIGFDKYITDYMYSFSLWIITISLIFHYTLTSPYINSLDVPGEYYAANLVIRNELWNYHISTSTNAMLGTVILAPIYQKICGISLTWVFKLVYPFILSLVPLGAYLIFQKIFDSKLSFFSCFLLVSTNSFYTIIPSVTKQVIAEYFLILIFLLMFNNILISPVKKSFLIIIYSIGLITAHYGTSYLFMFSLIITSSVLFFMRTKYFRRFCNTLSILKESEFSDDFFHKSNISSTFVLTYIIILFGWYIYISSSTIFSSIVLISDNVFHNIFTDLFDPTTSRGMQTFLHNPISFIGYIYKIVNWSVPLFIGIGIIYSLNHKTKIQTAYLLFSLYWYFICICSMAFSYFAVMNPQRLYNISLLLLAPYFIIGFTAIRNVFNINFFSIINSKRFVSVLSVYFALYFLFNSGVFFEIFNDPNADSISISQGSIKKSNDIQRIGSFYLRCIQEQDVASSQWLDRNRILSHRVYGTIGNNEGASALESYGMVPRDSIYMMSELTTVDHSYMYLLYANVVGNISFDLDRNLSRPIYASMDNYLPTFDKKNRIYNNGGGIILLSS